MPRSVRLRSRQAGTHSVPYRLGYDANLSAPIKAMLPETLRTANTLLDLMATPEGRAFWKRHGEPMDVVFDLSPGSRSMQVLEAYLTEKGYRL